MHIGEEYALVRSSTINEMFHVPPPLRAQKSSLKDPRGVAHSFLGVLLCFVAGCVQHPLHLNTRQEGVRRAVMQVDPYHDELPRLTRIIDLPAVRLSSCGQQDQGSTQCEETLPIRAMERALRPARYRARCKAG